MYGYALSSASKHCRNDEYGRAAGAVPRGRVVRPGGVEHGLQSHRPRDLERREVGVINIGGPGSISVDGESFTLDRKDGLYIGLGKRDVTFESEDTANPAHFYLFSAPSHAEYPTTTMKIADAEPVHLGDTTNSNVRTIYKYIHPDGVQSSQIMMGITTLEAGMWNTMPAHLHARRMEVYLYFDLDADNVVFHLMGDPAETRHLVMRNEEAAISPSWSIHSGMGTSSYSFVWAMAGENQAFADMDGVAMDDLR